MSEALAHNNDAASLLEGEAFRTEVDQTRALIWYYRYLAGHGRDALDEAVALAESVARDTPTGSAEDLNAANQLLVVLGERFDLDGRSEDVERAIEIGEQRIPHIGAHSTVEERALDRAVELSRRSVALTADASSEAYPAVCRRSRGPLPNELAGRGHVRTSTRLSATRK